MSEHAKNNHLQSYLYNKSADTVLCGSDVIKCCGSMQPTLEE